MDQNEKGNENPNEGEVAPHHQTLAGLAPGGVDQVAAAVAPTTAIVSAHFEGHLKSTLDAMTLDDPNHAVKIRYMTEEMFAYFKNAGVLNQECIKMISWQLQAPNGTMDGLANALQMMTEAWSKNRDRCVRCDNECDKGNCQCTDEHRRLHYWHGNMCLPGDYRHNDVADKEILRPLKLLYFLCSMGSGKTLPETLLPVLLDWNRISALRSAAKMDTEPCVLITAPGIEQVDQIKQQGLGVTDKARLGNMPMCVLSGIYKDCGKDAEGKSIRDASMLAGFNERVAYLDEHSSAQWFHPVNFHKLQRARVFVGGVAKVAKLLAYERDTLGYPPEKCFFHARKFALWLADEAHFGIHYPDNAFEKPDTHGEWSWILHNFSYAYVVKFSGSIHEVEDLPDIERGWLDGRVPKGGRCTAGELMAFRRMAVPRITVCSYEGLQKYDGTLFDPEEMTSRDVSHLRTHPRYLQVFFWEVMRDLMHRRKETGLPFTAMIRVPEIYGGVKGCVDIFNQFLKSMGADAHCPLTGRTLKACGTWGSQAGVHNQSQKEAARAMNSIRWAVECDLMFIFNKCTLGYNNESMKVTGNARHTSIDWDAGNCSIQFGLRCGRWATDSDGNQLGLKVAAVHHVGCKDCKEAHISECTDRSDKKDFRFDWEPKTLCAVCAPKVEAKNTAYCNALKAYNHISVIQTCGVFMQQIDCESDGHQLFHMTRYLNSQGATNIVQGLNHVALKDLQLKVHDAVDATVQKMRNIIDPVLQGQEQEPQLLLQYQAPQPEEGHDDDDGVDEEEEDEDEDMRPVDEKGADDNSESDSSDSDSSDSESGDDYSHGSGDGAGPYKSDQPARTRGRHKKELQAERSHESEGDVHVDSDGAAPDVEPVVFPIDPLVALRLREERAAEAATAREAAAEKLRIDEQKRKEEERIDEERVAGEAKEDEDDERVREQREREDRLRAEAKRAAREKLLIEKAEVARRAEEDNKQNAAKEVEEQKQRNACTDWNDTRLRLKCMQRGDEENAHFIRATMSRAPRINASVGVAWSKTGTMATTDSKGEPRTDGRSKTSFYLLQAPDNPLTPLQAQAQPFHLDFAVPKYEGVMHIRVFALTPGKALNDPDPKKKLTLDDLKYSTEAVTVTVDDLKQALADALEAGTLVQDATGEEAAVEVVLGTELAPSETETEVEAAPPPINWFLRARDQIWSHGVHKKHVHSEGGALSMLMMSSTPGDSGSSSNALLSCFLLDLFNVGTHGKVAPNYPRNLSVGWVKSAAWGQEYKEVLALYLEWLEDQTQTDKHEMLSSIQEHKALYTVDKVPTSDQATQIKAIDDEQSRGRRGARLPFLQADNVLSKFPDGWLRLEKMSRDIRDKSCVRKAVTVKDPKNTTAYVTHDVHDTERTSAGGVKTKQVEHRVTVADYNRSQHQFDPSVTVSYKRSEHQFDLAAEYDDFDAGTMQKYKEALLAGELADGDPGYKKPILLSTANDTVVKLKRGIFMLVTHAKFHAPDAIKSKLNFSNGRELMVTAMALGMKKGGTLDRWFHEYPSKENPLIADTPGSDNTPVQDMRRAFERYVDMFSATKPKPASATSPNGPANKANLTKRPMTSEEVQESNKQRRLHEEGALDN